MMDRRGTMMLWAWLAAAAMMWAGALPAMGQEGKGDEIVIGAYLSLTGSTATFGLTTKEGIDLAVKQTNEAGGVNGRKVRVIIYDNQGKTQETGAAVTRLVTRDKVAAVLGEVASTQSLAGAPICQRYRLPMITPSSTNPKVTQVGDMIFRVCFIDPVQGYIMARFAWDHLKARQVAILYDQRQAYSVGLRDAFVKSFKELGGRITTEQAYTSGTTDFSAQLTAIRDTKPDAIFVPGYYTEVGNIARQARRIGIDKNVPLLGGDGWESPKLPEIGGEAIDGSYYANHYAPEDQREESREFVKAYKEAYGNPPGALAALGYDAAMLLFDAMRRAPSLKGEDLAKAIGATRDFPGVTGRISLNADRDPVKGGVILQMKGGNPVYVTTIEPPAAGDKPAAK